MVQYTNHLKIVFMNILRVIIWELQNQLEIEKIDFLEILPIFNFCREMNKNSYFFSIFHFRFHGNHNFLFLAFFSNIKS